MHRVRQGVQAALNQQHLGAYYVILNSSQVIAQVKVTYMWSGWRNATTWWIQSVYVRPAYRRQGCFRRLYHHVRAAAAGAGAAGLRLCVKDGIAHGMVSQLTLVAWVAVCCVLVGSQPPRCCQSACCVHQLRSRHQLPCRFPLLPTCLLSWFKWPLT